MLFLKMKLYMICVYTENAYNAPLIQSDISV
jgi:hypothetical protein